MLFKATHYQMSAVVNKVWLHRVHFRNAMKNELKTKRFKIKYLYVQD